MNGSWQHVSNAEHSPLQILTDPANPSGFVASPQVNPANMWCGYNCQTFSLTNDHTFSTLAGRPVLMDSEEVALTAPFEKKQEIENGFCWRCITKNLYCRWIILTHHNHTYILQFQSLPAIDGSSPSGRLRALRGFRLMPAGMTTFSIFVVYFYFFSETHLQFAHFPRS